LSISAPTQATRDYPDARHLEFGYGGLYLGYHLLPERLLHPVFSMTVGAGGLALSDRSSDANDVARGRSNAVFVLEPEMGLEVNVVSFMRAQVTLSYRRVWGVDMPGLDNRDISGFAAGVALLFGQF
jgi:hypothetical protein